MAEQRFKEPLLIYENGNEKKVKTRTWSISDEAVAKEGEGIEYMGELGTHPVLEIWKHYYHSSKNGTEIFVSNLGYVMEMSKETFEEAFGLKLSEFKEGQGFFEYRNLTKEQKDLIKKCNFVPATKEESGLQIWLYAEPIGFRYGQIHRMVAERFLERPAEEAENGWVVHHIDNNSYNNSVTNLIYLKNTEEHGAFSKRIHRPSYR